MSSKTIVLGLVADRIDMLLCQRDRVIASRRINVAFDPNPDQWAKAVKEVAKAVKSAAAELRADGLSTYVLYRSPTECAEYAALNFRSATDAQQAAILACADSLSYPLDVAACQAVTLGRDSKGAQPQTHVIVAADRDDAVAAIAEMVDEAGLKFKWALPIDSAIMHMLAGQIMKTPGEPTGHLYIGEHRAFLVIGSRGAILFARPIGIGINALIACLRRPVRPINGSEPIELDRETARAILHEYGFPDRKQIVHNEFGLTGGQIIPLLQPLLQRLIVELRQSLRFGVSEGQRQTISLKIWGPGAAIPGFAAIIADELRLDATTDQRYSAYDCTKPGSRGSELIDALQHRKQVVRLGLTPQHVARSRQVKRLGRWLWTGAVTALLLIAADAVLYHTRLTYARQEAHASQARTNDIKTLQSTGEKLFAAISAMNTLQTAIDKETSGQVNLRACLQEISRLTPGTIRLTGISFHQSEGKTIGSVSGYAFASPTSGARTQLEPFIDELRKSPLFDKIVLSNVQIGLLGNVTGQRFEASFVGISAPKQLPAVAIAAGDGGRPQ